MIGTVETKEDLPRLFYEKKIDKIVSGRSLSVNFGYIWAYKGYLMEGYEVIGISYYL